MRTVYFRVICFPFQAIHFFYGVGAFVSPMIAQPFLLNEDCSRFIENASESVFPLDDNETLPAATLEEAQNMTQIDYAFIVMALTMVRTQQRERALR